MKNKVSLVQSKCITYFGNGIGWLLYVLLSVFDNKICSLMASVVLFISVTLSFWGLYASNEKDDEMSIQNMFKAKAVAMDWFRFIICFIILILTLLNLFSFYFPSINENIKISLSMVIPVIIGITDIMIGILFVRYEKDGE